MKLFYCPACHDLVVLRQAKTRMCECGKCSGQYIGDDSRAVVIGDQVQVFGVDNFIFLEVVLRALKSVPVEGQDDYHLPENSVDVWIFGPNALRQTKETLPTDAPQSAQSTESFLRTAEKYHGGLAKFIADVRASLEPHDCGHACACLVFQQFGEASRRDVLQRLEAHAAKSAIV